MSSDTVLMWTDTTPFALPFIGGVVLAIHRHPRIINQGGFIYKQAGGSPLYIIFF